MGWPEDERPEVEGTQRAGVDSDERTARLILTCVSEPGDLRLATHLEREGAVGVLDSLAGNRSETPWGRRFASLELDKVLRAAEVSGSRFVTTSDPEWPPGLDDLARCEPVQGLGGAPIGLWLRGPGHLADWCAASVAIVGSRAATGYGETVAGDLAYDLAGRGLTIVSGGAYGIDARAHHGALAVRGRTVSFLAGGVDIPYPKGNAALFERLAAEHLLAAEVPPGTTPIRTRFLTRNRLIAAASLGTVIVEGGLRSGARNTISWANNLARVAMAVPGSVLSATSVMPNQVIRSRMAELVCTAEEVLELVSPIGQQTLPQVRGWTKTPDGLDDVQLAVFDAVPGRGAITAGEVALKLGLDLPTVLVALSEVGEFGLIEETGDGAWRLMHRAVAH